MGIDYSGLAYPKGTPAVLSAHQKKVDAAKALKAAYDAVDARDGKKCRASGRPLTPGAVMAEMRLERHHLAKRSTHPERRHDPANIVTLSGLAHQLVEAGVLEIEGTDANKGLRFHWRLPAGTVPPFELLSRRKSQWRRSE